MNHTEEQVKDIQARIEDTANKVAEVLKENSLNIGGKIVKVEIAPGIFGDTIQIGYTDTKYVEKEEDKKVLKTDE